MLISWNSSGWAGETDFMANQGAGATDGFSFYNHDNSNNATMLMNISGNGTNQRAAYAETIEVFDVHEQRAVYAVQCVDRSRAT